MTVSGTGGERGPSRRPSALGSGTRRGATGHWGSEPPLSGVALESQLDQAVDQLRVRQAGGLPEARIGGEPGESWNGVDLVHPDARLALEKEVDAGETGGVDGAEGRDGEALELPHEAVTQRGRDDDLGDAFGVL